MMVKKNQVLILVVNNLVICSWSCRWWM